jgi:hypothetical protein
LSNFNIQEVKYFPIICDFAVQCYIPVTFGEGKEVSISLMELILFDFCNWLYLRKLTPIRTSFAREFKLDYKPPPSKSKHPKLDPFRDMYHFYNLVIRLTKTRRNSPKKNRAAKSRNFLRRKRQKMISSNLPARIVCLDSIRLYQLFQEQIITIIWQEI